MKNLVIASTKKKPEIIFKTSGELMLSGNSLPANINKFYEPVIDWLEDLKIKSPSKITITFELHHINTSSTRMILQILRKLSKIANGKKKLNIVWIYDTEDTDMLEQGEALQEIIHRSFEFVVKED
ncbi:MAG: DUF1987 domain-containing protein [Bacteroidetes bacterium]|nr:DUF1987 domain-containing protein [Bacteroidota bacterium]